MAAIKKHIDENDVATLLKQSIAVDFISVVNESHLHNVPKDATTHFKIVVVAKAFERQSLVMRHRRIHSILKPHFTFHALSLVLLTPEEWASRDNAIDDSPPCLGGSQKDKPAP